MFQWLIVHGKCYGSGMDPELRLGTCSWKYDSWRGRVYSDAARINYLAEYAQRYNCVEIDQWFWSLYGLDKVVLPKSAVVEEYARSVPDSFRFGVKMPNALTVSHFRQTRKIDPLESNPHFLSIDVLNRTLERLEALYDKLGPLMFQFGYLNKQKLASQAEFLEKLGTFVSKLPAGFNWCIETRNPNYLNDRYFAFLREHNVAHVFLHGYYMPPIFGLYDKYADQVAGDLVVRLHGPDREGIEEKAGKDWSRIIEPRNKDLDAVCAMLEDARVRRRTQWLFVNNHFEGCAPLTIERIRERME